jgi:acetate---CoA ligase (ADP-forming)
MRPLERLYNPKSIAVVGASADESKAGYQMLYSLRDFPGELYPINPKTDSILGFKSYPSLKAIGKPVDLVVLTIPAASCINVLKEAGEAGAGSALIISGGFAETGVIGHKLQNNILSVCKKNNIRLLGPNTAGFVNPWARVVANFNPWTADISAGYIGLVSQSGAMCLTLASMIHAQKLGVSLATGIGNAADVNVPDAVEYLADDPETKVIILYLEGVKEGRRLYDVICRTTEKKPVLVLAVGKGDIAEFAASHTGNLLGSYKIKKTALKQAGAVFVDSSGELIDAANLLSRSRLIPKENPGVGLLTGQAGPGMIIADYLRSKDVLLPELSPATVERIKEALPPLTFIRNPVDTSRPSGTFPDILNAMSLDPSIDVIAVFALSESAVIDPVMLFRDTAHIKQPLVFGTAGLKEEIDATRNFLYELNIASFPFPDRVARAVHVLVEDSKAAYRRMNITTLTSFKVCIAPFRSTPDEGEAKHILDQIGISTPKRSVCKSHKEAIDAFISLRKPIVAKILDASIHHKTEIGGVILGIDTEGDLENALNSLDVIMAGNSKKYLLEEMAEDGLEIIIGATNDRSFGPAVMVGLGGITAEALEDVTMRMAPLGQSEARDMILELRGKALFKGWRGSKPLDIDCLAETLVLIGQLMVDHSEINEMDFNPVRIYEKGISVLDALIIVDDDNSKVKS